MTTHGQFSQFDTSAGDLSANFDTTLCSSYIQTFLNNSNDHEQMEPARPEFGEIVPAFGSEAEPGQ